MKKKTKEPEIQISEKERQAYVQAYVNSQIDANKRMSIALAVVGVLLLLLFIGFLCNLFGVAHQTFILICIAFPVCIVLLFGPITFIKSKRLEKPTFRIFIISLFVLVVAIFNIVLPKHSLYGWAILIVLTNHYYNTKLGINVFISTLILLLLCMYLGMFLGEYDPHLLSGQLNGNDDTIHNLFLNQVYQDTPQGRMAYLHDLIQVGQNRYLSVLTQYYLPRSVLISIIFFISNSLNKRTGELLKDEILVGINQQKTKKQQ